MRLWLPRERSCRGRQEEFLALHSRRVRKNSSRHRQQYLFICVTGIDHHAPKTLIVAALHDGENRISSMCSGTFEC